MNNPFDYIEEFLAGELSIKEHAQFEKALLKDPNLREEVHMVREMELFVQRKVDKKNALDVVKNVMEEWKRMEEGKKQSSLLIKAVAASVILCLLALASWVYFSQEGEKKTGHEELFAEYFERPEMAITRKGEAQDSILQIVQGLFNSEQYERSLQEFDKLESSDELDLYKAINNLTVNNPENSIAILNSISNKTNDTYWYLALAYLRLGDNDDVKEWLLKIDSTSVHYLKSQTLIMRL